MQKKNSNNNAKACLILNHSETTKLISMMFPIEIDHVLD